MRQIPEPTFYVSSRFGLTSYHLGLEGNIKNAPFSRTLHSSRARFLTTSPRRIDLTANQDPHTAWFPLTIYLLDSFLGLATLPWDGHVDQGLVGSARNPLAPCHRKNPDMDAYRTRSQHARVRLFSTPPRYRLKLGSRRVTWLIHTRQRGTRHMQPQTVTDPRI